MTRFSGENMRGIRLRIRSFGKLINAGAPAVRSSMPMERNELDRTLELARSPSMLGKKLEIPSLNRTSYPWSFLLLLKIGCLAT